MSLDLKTVGDAEAWGKRVRKAGIASQGRAYAKLGRKQKIHVAVPKVAVSEKKVKPEGISRSTGVENKQGIACPNCWAVPMNVRNDGFTIARHLPLAPQAPRYRDTEFCDGQGKIGVQVMDTNWKPGTEPRKKMSAKKFNMGKGVKV